MSRSDASCPTLVKTRHLYRTTMLLGLSPLSVCSWSLRLSQPVLELLQRQALYSMVSGQGARALPNSWSFLACWKTKAIVYWGHIGRMESGNYCVIEIQRFVRSPAQALVILKPAMTATIIQDCVAYLLDIKE